MDDQPANHFLLYIAANPTNFGNEKYMELDQTDFFVIVIIHVSWFTYFAFTISEDIEVKDSKQNLPCTAGRGGVLLLLYFFLVPKNGTTKTR